MQNKININELLTNDNFVDWVNNPNINNSQRWLELMKDSVENKRKIEEAKKLIKSINTISGNEFDEESSVKEISNQWKLILKQSKTKKKSFRWLKYAALLLISLSVVGTLYKTKFSESSTQKLPTQNYDNITVTFSDGEVVEIDDKQEVAVTTSKGNMVESKDGELHVINKQYASNLNWQAIKVPKGRKIAIFLPDGTKVHLNSNTELEYPDKFGNKERLVKLKGEAFFEVTHNREKPFIVESNNQKITVLGTKFNISCYDDEKLVKTTLVEGSVKINSKINPESIILEPGEQSSLAIDGSILSKTNVDTKFYTSWINEVMYFKNEKLETLSKKLERWYAVDIVFESEASKNIRFTGVVRKEKSIDHIMKLIEKTSEIKISSNKNKIIIN
jgi:ferric-dicitrate binding protein FerR (iron transport regulator)